MVSKRPELRKTEDIFNRVMVKDNVAVIARFEVIETGRKFIVANAHLHWDPEFKDVKLVQTAVLLEDIAKLAKEWSSKEGGDGRIPTFICGDFNSTPDSGVYELMSNGFVPHNHSDFMNYQYGPFTEEGLSHSLQLQSAYTKELEFTNWTPTFKGIIDYIWYSSHSVNVVGVLGGIDKDYIGKTVGFPNWHHPSDHIPILSQFRFRNINLDKSKRDDFGAFSSSLPAFNQLSDEYNNSTNVRNSARFK